MLESLRRSSQSYLIYFFFGIIIVVFVFFFGPQSEGCAPGRVTVVAQAASVEVGSRQLESVFQNTVGRAQQREINPQFRRRQLAEDIALVRYFAMRAKEAGFAVSDEQFVDYITDPMRNPDLRYYATYGEFDHERYERAGGNFGMALSEYEVWKEDELLTILYLNTLEQAITVAPEEIEARYSLQERRYDLEFVSLAAGQSGLLLPEPYARVLGNENLEALQALYDERAESLRTTGQLRVRRILIRLPGDEDNEADDAERAAQQQIFDDALARIQENPDSFAEVAEEVSQASESRNGGDMGLRGYDFYDDFPFIRENLESAELDEVYTHEQENSVIIYRVEERDEPRQQTFEEVLPELVREWALPQLADRFLRDALEGKTFEEIAQEHANEVATAVRDAEIAEEAARAAEEEAALELTPEVTSPEDAARAEGRAAAEDLLGGAGDAGLDALFSTDDGTTTEATTDATDATDPTAPDGTPTDVTATPVAPDGTSPETPINSPQDDPVVVAQTEEPVTEIPVVLEPITDAAPLVRVRTTRPFALDRQNESPTRIPSIGEVPELVQMLQQLTVEDPVAPQVFSEGDRLVIARLLEVIEPEELDDAAREALRRTIWAEKRQALFGPWQNRLIGHSPISLSPFLLAVLEEAVAAGDIWFEDSYFEIQVVEEVVAE